jgi:uncharacterized membrane protein YedE/YeeE
MFRDIFLFRNTFKFRSLVLYFAVTAFLFEGARLAGLLPLYPFPLLGPATVAAFAGGVLFGIGMVLAGGCVVGTLYRMGAGSLLSLAAFAGLIAGSTLYAEFHPWWKPLLATKLFGGATTLPASLGSPPTPFVLLFVALLLLASVRWFRAGKMQQKLYARGGMQLWQAALILSGVSLASYLLVGMPLGITTAYAKTGAMLWSAVTPGHVASLDFFRATSLSYVVPLTGQPLVGGPGPGIDGIALVQFPLIAGIVGGGFLSALSLGEFKVYRDVPVRQYLSALAGGVIMGMASRMAPGCNVWHLLGGVPILAISSTLFLAGLLPGAWIGSKFLSTWVVR